MLFYIVPFLSTLYYSLINNMADKKWGKMVLFFLLIPLIVPSGTTIAFWKSVFGKTGLISSLWQMAGNKPLSLENSGWAFVVLLMSIVNSFKVFKEVYMLYGAYPTPSIYMLQHYMNNQFTAMNMQKLSASAWVMFVVLGAMLWVVYKLQCRMTDYSGG